MNHDVALSEGITDIVDDLRGVFFEELSSNRVRLEEAFASRDVPVIRRIAHDLAGMAATFGYPSLGECARTFDRGSADAAGQLLEVEFRAMTAQIDRALEDRAGS